MPMNRDIISHFHIEYEDYDAIMSITFSGKNQDMLDTLMKSISFDTNEFEFIGSLPQPNTNSLKRVVYIKKKIH